MSGYFFKNTAKYALFISVSMISLQANAWDFTPDSTRILSDPAFFPTQGQVYGTTGYSYSGVTGDITSNNGVRDHYRNDTNNVNQRLEYGITNDIMVGVTDSYDWRKDKDSYSNGNTFDYNLRGFTDPSFEVDWRARDQKDSTANLDFFAFYSPDAFDARQATTTRDGRIAFGGQTASLGSSVSYETKDFTAYGSGEVTYLGSHNYDTSFLTSSSTTDDDARWQYSLSVDTQTRLCKEFSVNLGATETFNTKLDGHNAVNQSVFSYNAANVTDLAASFNYTVIPNKLVAAITYNYDIYGSNNLVSNGQFIDHYNNETGSVAGVKLFYTFN